MKRHNPHFVSGAQALKQADRAARRGDLGGAERWAKTAERMAAAAERFKAAAPEEAEARSHQETRDDVLARIARLVATPDPVPDWEAMEQGYINRVADEWAAPAIAELPVLAPTPDFDAYFDAFAQGREPPALPEALDKAVKARRALE